MNCRLLQARFTYDALAWLNDIEIINIRQLPSQSEEAYSEKFLFLHDKSGFSEDTRTISGYIRGLLPQYQLDTYRQCPEIIHEAVVSAKIAELSRKACNESSSISATSVATKIR